MLLDIRPDHLKIVQEILERIIPDREVWAFGSRATGTARNTSDLDLAVIGETPLDFQTLGALRDAFSESDIPYMVDVVDWARISETFRNIISKDKVVIQKGVTNGSGIEGFVSSWQELPFSQAVSVNPRVHLVRGKVYPFVDMTAVSANSHCVRTTEYRLFHGSGAKFVAGDTLMARITPCLENGKIARFCAEPGVAAHGSTEFIVVRGREDLTENDYAYYLTKWDSVRSYAISQMSGTSGRQRVQTTAFDHLLVPIPPLPEQRAIAHILGTLDDKIELDRRMNETLEAMARAIFKSWFVDFDPVRAKAEGRETGLPKEIEDLFPDGFEDSELGEIPRGWKATTIGEVFELNPTERLPKGNAAPYLDMAAVPTHGSYPDLPILRPFTSGSKYRNGDTLFARITPCLENGKTAFIQSLQENEIAWGSTEFIVIRPKEPFSKEFGYLLARDNAFREHAIQSMSGTSGRQRVQESALAAFKIVEPNSRILKFFGILVSSWFQGIKLNSEQIFSLTQIRDTLLPKLLSGEIRVKDAEMFLERAL